MFWRSCFYIKVALESFLCLFHVYKLSFHLKPGHEVSSKPDHAKMLIMDHPLSSKEGEVKIKLYFFVDQSVHDAFLMQTELIK